jgi:hypothetical protein
MGGIMLSRYVDIALHFWNQHVQKNRELAMSKVVAILPLAFTDEEFVSLKKSDPLAQVKYLNKVHKTLNQTIMSGDLKVSEDINEVKRSIKLAKETWVTFYVPVASLSAIDKSIVIKKATQPTFPRHNLLIL